MPQIINNFIVKVLRLVTEFFQAELFEYGIIDVTKKMNNKTIFVGTQNDVLRVWFSLQKSDDPYMEVMGHDSKCFVGEPRIVPGGFEFEVMAEAHCRVSWFAVER